jgi:acyl-CoA reductase-like NAD-dependent aldehyde dehydrogenase
MANDCDVGLGAFIITESISRSWRVTEALEVGMVGVNLGLLSGEYTQRCGAKTVAQVRISSRSNAGKCLERCLKMRWLR